MNVAAAQELLSLLKDGMVGGDAPRRNRLGVIDPEYTAGPARVLFDGEDEVSGKGYAWLAPYSPSANDRVALMPVGKLSYVILGGATVALESEPGTLPVSRGGTGASTESGARKNLDVYSTSEADAAVAALGVELVDEINQLVATHAAEEQAARALAIQTAVTAAVTALRQELRPIVLTSPDGTRWKLGVADDGATVWTEVP